METDTQFINFIGGNELTKARLRVFTEHHPSLVIYYSEQPLKEILVDAYVITAGYLDHLLRPVDRPATWLPVIVYGNHNLLPVSYAAGCADFIKEPWSPEELFYRIQRLKKNSASEFPWGRIDPARMVLEAKDGRTLALNEPERTILRVLLKQREQVVPREVLFYALWGRRKEGSRAVDMHICKIRKKLTTLVPGLNSQAIIRSVRGQGYLLL